MICNGCNKVLSNDEAEVMKKFSFDVCVECRKKREQQAKIKRPQEKAEAIPRGHTNSILFL